MDYAGNYGNKPGFASNKNSSLSKMGQMTLGNKKPFEMGVGGGMSKNSERERGTSRGAKNITTNLKFNDQDINEAKESLKLLKQKVNTANTMNKFGGLTNTLSSNNNNLTNNNGNPFPGVGNLPNTSHNYRKVFKPDLASESNNKMKQGAYNSNNSTGSGGNQQNKFNFNNKPSFNNVESKISKQNINPVFSQPPKRKFQAVEEVEDERPAYAKGDPVEPELPEEADTGNLVECGGCGRKFNPDVFDKHSKACKKVFQSKRKAFDMKKKRIIDSEHAMILKHAEVEEKTNTKLKQIKQKKKENWKKQSEMLRQVAQANKTGMDFMKQNSGNVLQVGKNTVTPSYSDDLTLCNYCNRRYKEDVYQKHLGFCERKAKEKEMKSKGASSSNARPAARKK